MAFQSDGFIVRVCVCVASNEHRIPAGLISIDRPSTHIRPIDYTKINKNIVTTMSSVSHEGSRLFTAWVLDSDDGASFVHPTIGMPTLNVRSSSSETDDTV